MTYLRKFSSSALILLIALAALDAYFFAKAFWRPVSAGSREYFLNVGSGESELVVLPGGIKILTDAGPAGAAVDALENVLGNDERYIDIAVVSYGAPDRFEGFVDLLDQYNVGAFIWNGREDGASPGEWGGLAAKISEKGIPLVTLGAGDRIRVGTSEVDILSPDASFAAGANQKDASIVELVREGGESLASGLRTLLAGAADLSVEQYLLTRGVSLRADVLKIADHGSADTVNGPFLRAVHPTALVIEAGTASAARPAAETLAQIASSTSAQVFRTDRDGTVSIALRADHRSLDVTAEK